MSRPLAIIGNVNVDIIVGDCPPILHPGTVHGHPVTARLKPGAVRDVGRPVRVAVDMSRASLFDPATELRIV